LVWRPDAVSEPGFAALKGKGLTRLTHAPEARDPLVLAGALETIGQHHPDEVVWVDAAASAG